MSLSTTAFTDRIFPQGSLEWHQQERLRRIQRLQEQRENQRLQALFLREIRSQQAEVTRNAAPRPVNNNTQLSTTRLVGLKKTTSVKLPTKTNTSSAHPLKKSKSVAAKPLLVAATTEAQTTRPLVPVQSRPTPAKKVKKTRKTKSKASTAKVSKKSSTAVASTSRKISTTLSKVTKPTTAIKSLAPKPAASSLKVKGSTAKVKSSNTKVKTSSTNVKKAISSKTPTTKVSFSGPNAGNVDGKGCVFCPATTPASILKNRQKIENLMKSTLQPSVASKENLAKQVASPTKAAPMMDLFPEPTGLSFKPFPLAPPNPPQQPNLGVCKAFPGTKEWDEYWSKFAKAMNNYGKEMTEYEQKAAESFKEDLARYSEQTRKLTREREIYKNLGSKGIELGLIPPPPITSKELKGLQLFNGYIMKSKGIKGTASNLPGSPAGVRFEVDVRGAELENVMIQKDHNLLTISMEAEKFLRIGTPSGKLAGDIQVWPPIDGRIIIDAP